MTPRGAHPPVVALDGPAGSGKSSVAAAVAERLGVPHVDTGAYYRAATLAVLRAGVDPQDAHAVADVVADAVIDRVDGRTRLDGDDVEDAIRGPEVTAAVSAVSANPDVRRVLLAAQQAGIARTGGVVDGRDAATRVVPDAHCKVWLDADARERGRRRAAQAGQPERVDDHVADLRRRDAADAAQSVRHPDAVVIDTTAMTFDEVVDTVADLVANGPRTPDD